MTADDERPLPAHPQVELAPAYALGALDADELAAFEAHHAGCALCQAEVRRYGEVAARLALAVPPVRPPAALRARIVAEARATQGPATHPAAQPDAPTSDVIPLHGARRAAGPRRATRWLPWLAAAAALVLAVALGTQWRRERDARVGAERTLAAERRAGAARDSLLAAVLAPDVRMARLTATGAEMQARVYWERSRGMVVLTASALPRAPDGRTYQLWGIPTGGTPRSLGTFDTDSTGRVRLMMPVPAGAAMDVAAITEEPAGGSPQPTSQPILVGTLGTE